MTNIYIHLNVIVKNVQNDLLRIFKVNEEDDEYVPYSPSSSSSIHGHSPLAHPPEDEQEAAAVAAVAVPAKSFILLLCYYYSSWYSSR